MFKMPLRIRKRTQKTNKNHFSRLNAGKPIQSPAWSPWVPES